MRSLDLVQVLMATNRIDILDPALLRPGRIDRKIEFPNPNESSRADILRIHSRKMNLVRGIDLRKIADKMTGASGAELKVISCQSLWYSASRARESRRALVIALYAQCAEGSCCTRMLRGGAAATFGHTHLRSLLHLHSIIPETWTAYVKASRDTTSTLQACCTEAGMFALRERRVHVTQVGPLTVRALYAFTLMPWPGCSIA